MLRILLALTVVATSSVAAQAHDTIAARSRGTSPGDSVWVVIHRVRAAERAQYDSLMQHVWWPAAQQAAKRYPAFARQLTERRRYVPAAQGADSAYTYVYLYFGRPALPIPQGGGNGVLRAAGMSRAQSDAFDRALQSMLVVNAGGPLVDEPYR